MDITIKTHEAEPEIVYSGEQLNDQLDFDNYKYSFEVDNLIPLDRFKKNKKKKIKKKNKKYSKKRKKKRQIVNRLEKIIIVITICLIIYILLTLKSTTKMEVHQEYEQKDYDPPIIVPKYDPNLPCKQQAKVLQGMMTEDELALLKKYIGQNSSYFEWGSGGSTDTFGRFTDGTIVSIENFKPWCAKVSALPFVKCRKIMGNLHYKCIVPYPTLAYGYPKYEERNGDFDEYIDAIAEFPNFDVILVDGRWRIACALKALDYIRDDTIVFLHDVNSKRPYYKRLFDEETGWYDVVENSSSLIALKRRKNRTRPSKNVTDYFKNKPQW
jgi:hypothetical protein